MKANRWSFTDGMISYADRYESKCKADTWYGFKSKQEIGNASKSFKGKGTGYLRYTNCFNESYKRYNEYDNTVEVYLKGVMVSKTNPGNIRGLRFVYKEDDELTLKEEYAIIKILQMGLDCVGMRNIIQYLIYLVEV